MPNILIIDDEGPIRSMLRRYLEKRGYAIREAETGVVGREILAHWAADLVICDIAMPQESGIETIGRLRQDRPGIKIIILSGGFSVEQSGLAGFLGADLGLKKSTPLKDLLDAITRLLAADPKPTAAA